jgi:hypothetical protein
MEVSVTEPATARRPSPRPRPAGTPPRPDQPHLRVVETPNSEMPSSGSPVQAPTETISAGHDLGGNRSGIPGFRVRRPFTWAATRTYWTPPALFTDRPASLADLRDYATAAPWTSQNTGLLRGFGVGWYRTVAYPATVACRYWEWAWQRPLRVALHLGLVKVAAMTGPGIWVTDHLVYPAARVAGHIFL